MPDPDPSPDPSVLLDFHGVTVRFRSSVADHLHRLRRDYGLFVVDSLDAPPTIDCTVGLMEGESTPSATAVVAGPLGDEIALGPGTVSVTGPHLTDSAAYRLEIRSYLTGSILAELTRDRTVQQLHASAVSGTRGGVLFAGAKKMGKTSMALLALTGGASYLANDISLVELPAGGGHPLLFGLPQPLSVGMGAADWFARHRPHTGIAPPDIGDAPSAEDRYNLEIGEKLEVGLDDVRRFTDVVTAQVPLGAVVFPEAMVRLREPRIVQLSPDDALVRLMMLGESFVKWGFPPPVAGDRYVERLHAVVRGIVASVPCFHFQWCADHELNARVLGEHAL